MGNGRSDELTGDEARVWWRSLMENVVSLIEDAAALLANDSPGRARSLVILAEEELAKAVWIYDEAHLVWSAAIGVPGTSHLNAAASLVVPEEFTKKAGLAHLSKLMETERFGSGLAAFWGQDDLSKYLFPGPVDEFETSARELNEQKKAGFYVDRVGGAIMAPQDVARDGVADFLIRVGGVAEMMLIQDHTRQQDAPEDALTDFTHGLQWRLMPYSHPDDFEDFVSRIS